MVIYSFCMVTMSFASRQVLNFIYQWNAWTDVIAFDACEPTDVKCDASNVKIL